MFDDSVPRPADTLRWPLIGTALLALALLVPLAAPAAAHAGADEIVLEAREDGCSDRTYCFEVVEGSLDDIEADEEIQITLVNPEDNALDHNVQLTQLSEASSDRDTSEDAAETGTEDLAPGEEASFEYLVTPSSEGLYLWCSVNVHEDQGMYLEVPLGEEGTGDEGSDTNDSPAAGALAALAALAGIALLLRRD